MPSLLNRLRDGRDALFRRGVDVPPADAKSSSEQVLKHPPQEQVLDQTLVEGISSLTQCFSSHLKVPVSLSTSRRHREL